MNDPLRRLKNRKFAVPAVCGVGTLLTAYAAFGGNMVSAKQLGFIIFGLYVGSKVFMAGVALWLCFKHSSRFRQFFGFAKVAQGPDAPRLTHDSQRAVSPTP